MPLESVSVAEAVFISTSIRRPAEEVYRFARDPRNLSRWITSFVDGVEERDSRWFLRTSSDGDWELAFIEENPYGLLDHRVITPDGKTFYNPMRVVANGPEGPAGPASCSTVSFTLFRQDGMSDADFARDQGLIRDDLEMLKRVLEEISQR